MRGTTFKHEGATVLGDLPGLRPRADRTTLVRVGLALALAATLAGAILLARSAGSGRPALLPVGRKTGVVVVDMSGSVSGGGFKAIAAALRGLAAANQAMGLVMFSDTAYELLPPNSPTSSLIAFEHFFDPQADSKGAPPFGSTPWDQFTSGTRISQGLRMGRQALQRAGVTHGALLLVSDLADSSADQESLVAEASVLRKAHIPLRIIPAHATTANMAVFAALFGKNSFVQPDAYRTTATEKIQPVASSWPLALVFVGTILVGLLAANELFNTRLRPEGAT
jgi:hypothetical protein